MGVKYEYAYVKEYFDSQGCELIGGSYSGVNEHLDYRCSCGNLSKITFSSFKGGARCQKCKAVKLREVFSLSFDYVKTFFAEQGCELLETNYINANTPMAYRCSCGNTSKVRFECFKKGNRCKKCGVKIGSRKQSFTLQEAQEYFTKEGCQLLATEYINNQTPMPYICKCGNKDMVRFGNFKRGNRCKKCAGRAQPTLEEVEQYFKHEGCKLLATEYVNNSTKMPYICKCGRQSMIRWADFKIGNRCYSCRSQKLRDAFVTSFEEVAAFFAENDCILLATEYVDNQTPMPYICKCGKKAMASLHHMKDGKHCKQCGIKKMQESQRLSFEVVVKTFTDGGCTLLATEYEKNSTPMPYICSCGNKSKISLSNFQKGRRCKNCKPRSAGELKISKYLNEKQVPYKTEISIADLNHKRFDFQIGDLFIEFHGKQHYLPFAFNSQKKFAGQYALLGCIDRDHKKLSYCKEKGIKLLIIPFWSINEVESILDEAISNKEVKFNTPPPKDVIKSKKFRQQLRDHLKILEPETLYGLVC